MENFPEKVHLFGSIFILVFCLLASFRAIISYIKWLFCFSSLVGFVFGLFWLPVNIFTVFVFKQFFLN